jgi:hypothetical protein
MIQRIQSIFLLIAGGGFFSLFKFPFAMSNETVTPIFEDQLYTIQDNPILLGVCILGGILSLGAIFLFNNRILQKRISLFGAFVGLVLAGFAIYLMTSINQDVPSNVGIETQAGLFMPALSVLMLILASVFINKDEKLVRSSDRLR